MRCYLPIAVNPQPVVVTRVREAPLTTSSTALLFPHFSDLPPAEQGTFWWLSAQALISQLWVVFHRQCCPDQMSRRAGAVMPASAVCAQPRWRSSAAPPCQSVLPCRGRNRAWKVNAWACEYDCRWRSQKVDSLHRKVESELQFSFEQGSFGSFDDEKVFRGQSYCSKHLTCATVLAWNFR